MRQCFSHLLILTFISTETSNQNEILHAPGNPYGDKYQTENVEGAK